MTCAGLLDALGAGLARAAPDAPLGLWLRHTNLAILLVGVAALATLLRKWTRSWTAAAAVSTALGFSALLAPAASPFDAFSLLIAVLTFTAITWNVTLAAIGGLVLLASIAPRAGLLLAIMAGLLVHRRAAAPPSWPGRRASIVAAVAVAATIGLPWLVPALPPTAGTAPASCGPVLWPADFGAWLTGWRSVFSAGGAYGLGLSAVGALALIRDRRRDLLWPAAIAVAASVGLRDHEALLPQVAALVVAFAVLAAAGLRDLAAAAGRTLPGRAGAAVAIVLLPLLAYSTATHRSAPDRSNGADALSLRDVTRVLAVLPDGATLVDEDATVRTLLRAADGTWQRANKRLGIVPAAAGDVRRLLEAGAPHVYALPFGQGRLQWLGFVLAPANLPGVSGVANVSIGGTCVELTPGAPTSSTAMHTAVVAVASESFGTAHGVVVYASMDEPRHPSPVIPVTPGRLGFSEDIYTRTNPDDEARLAELLAADGVTPTAAPGPTVARIEVWREAGLPPILPIDLGGAPRALTAVSDGPPGTDRVCPAFPYKTQALKIQN